MTGGDYLVDGYVSLDHSITEANASIVANSSGKSLASSRDFVRDQQRFNVSIASVSTSVFLGSVFLGNE